MSHLKQVQSTVQHVVTAISAAMGVDVASIDDSFELVATSKIFLQQRGTDMNKNFLKHVFQRGTYVLPNPGHNELCRGCRYEGNCPETAEILRCIYHEGRLVGVILMVAYTQVQREMLLSKTAPILEFLGEMASLIISELKLSSLLEQEKLISSQLETTLDLVDKGIIAVDEEETVSHINSQAASALRCQKVEALWQPLTRLLPSLTLSRLLKEGLKIKNQEIATRSPGVSVLISGRPIRIGPRIAGAVLSVEDVKHLRRFIYEYSAKPLIYTFADIQGVGAAIRKTKEYARQVASYDSSVLIQGESGTGKELFARAIHHHSPRGAGPFIPINCAAIPEGLLESELFGYEEGAFSGARQGGKPGKFELASGGTIFLDEIADMPLHMQAKLLRVLQEKNIERVGSIKSISVNVRIIAATNQDLFKLCKKKLFREDLYFRLNVVPLDIPPLRQRRKDILALADFFLNKYGTKYERLLKGFSTEARRALVMYHWPGNVRELENAVEYSINMEKSDRISEKSLPPQVQRAANQPRRRNLARRLKEYETVILHDVLETHGSSLAGKKMAARELGISLPTLYRKLKSLDLD